MKKFLTVLIMGMIFFTSSYANNWKLYLGVRGGAGVMLTQAQLNNFGTFGGIVDASNNTRGWTIHANGEVLAAYKRLRFGYQFRYNFSQPATSASPYSALFDNDRTTTYFNSKRNNFLAHYFLIEVAVVDIKHFALAPGIAVGSFNGFNIDKNNNESVSFRAVTHHRFTIGAELNFEIKFGRCVILLSPNYYMYSMQDKTNADWRQYNHMIGGDIGFRVNLLKQDPGKSKKQKG